MCCGTRVVVLCKSRDVEIVQDAGGVFNSWPSVSYAAKRDLRCRLEQMIYILEFLRFSSYPAFCWLMSTKRPVTGEVECR